MKPAERVKWLREELTRHNDAYFVNDAPLIPDVDYDALARELRSLEEQHPELADDTSVSTKVGATTSAVFGPVLSLMHAASIDQAIELVNQRSYGNMACIFTTDGSNARRFRYEVNAGNVGINVGVAAPMSTFPFSGWGESFFGDLHAQAHHGVEFYTQTKVVVERWPRDWSRKF